jgi:hypothetical protein
MPTLIPRIFLNKEYFKEQKIIKNTLPLTALLATDLNIICNIYNTFLKLNTDKQDQYIKPKRLSLKLFLKNITSICYPERKLVSKDQVKLLNKLIKLQKELYTFPYKGNNGTELISTNLFNIELITRESDPSIFEKVQDDRIQLIIDLKINEKILDLFWNEIKSENKNYITLKTTPIQARGERTSKIAKLQHFFDSELVVLGMRKKYKQNYDRVKNYEFEEIAKKLGDEKFLKKSKTKYLDSLESCIKILISSDYPILRYILDKDKKSLLIHYQNVK